WTLLGQTLFAGSEIHSIVISPTDPNVVFVSAFGFFGGNGIFRTMDGGATWTNITARDPILGGLSIGTGFFDGDLAPTNLSILYSSVCSVQGSTENGVYKSTNALSANPTFNFALGGSTVLPGSLPGTIDTTVSPTQPSTIYVQFGERGDPRNNLRS